MPSFKRAHTQEKHYRVFGMPIFGIVQKRTEEEEYLGSSKTRTNEQKRLRHRSVRMLVAKCIAWVMPRVILGIVLILFGPSG